MSSGFLARQVLKRWSSSLPKQMVQRADFLCRKPPCSSSFALLSPYVHSRRRVSTTSIVRSSLSESNIFAPEDVPTAVAVKTISDEGIELVNGLILPSGCIFLGGQVFLWSVPAIPDTASDWDAWTIDHFKVFEVVVPKPEILILGTGEKAILPPPRIRQYLSSIGIQLDIMNTWNACSTYNLLVEEGRKVAAALIPPSHRQWASAAPPLAT